MGAQVVTEYGYDEIKRLTREATCDSMSLFLHDDGGNRTEFMKMDAVYSKDREERIRRDLQKRRPGRKVRERGDITMVSSDWIARLRAPIECRGGMSIVSRDEEQGRDWYEDHK